MKKTEIDPDEELSEDADFLVCARANDDPAKADYVFDDCCVCGVAIMYPPDAPRKPKRICMKCAIEQMAEESKNV
jgi:hypothetical protein